MAQPSLDPTSAFAELGRFRLDETDLDGVLSRIAELAARTIPGARDVSVTLVREAVGRTAAFTGPLAVTLDEWQYAHGSGPCLDASVSGDTVVITDTTTEIRWPEWAVGASLAGVTTSLSIGLPIQEAVVGALNIYGVDARLPSPESIGLARTFAGYAAVALANAHLYESTATLAEQMQTAMRSRAVIEQAKGIIMGEHRCTAEEAFGLLSRVSQESNRKLRDVASALVERAAGQSGS